MNFKGVFTTFLHINSIHRAIFFVDEKLLRNIISMGLKKAEVSLTEVLAKVLISDVEEPIIVFCYFVRKNSFFLGLHNVFPKLRMI